MTISPSVELISKLAIMHSPFKLIIITTEKEFPNEVEILEELFQLGVRHFHIRKEKDALTHQLISKCSAHILPHIVVHANKISLYKNVKGIHLKEKFRSQAELFSNKIISTGFHSFDELEQDTYPYEYVFFSPLFDSISKPGYFPKYSEESLKKYISSNRSSSTVRPALIALGGVTVENIAKLKEMGFDGAAVLGSLWNSNDPVAYYKQLVEQIK